MLDEMAIVVELLSSEWLREYCSPKVTSYTSSGGISIELGLYRTASLQASRELTFRINNVSNAIVYEVHLLLM